MIMKIYSVRDVLVGYTSVVLYSSDAVAIRDFKSVVNLPDTPISKSAKDYSLYCVGEFDTETGVVVPCMNKVCEAYDLKDEKNG